MAILMRNELFGRLLYLITNTVYAKVCDKAPKLTGALLGILTSALC